MITEVKYASAYTLSRDFNSVKGDIEATATVDEGQTPEEAYQVLRKQVRKWLKSDFCEGDKLLQQILDRQK